MLSALVAVGGTNRDLVNNVLVCPHLRTLYCATMASFERKLTSSWFTMLSLAEMSLSYADKPKAGASAPPAPAPPAAATTAATNEYGTDIQGCLVRGNVPSYNTGNGRVVTRVTALLVVDLERKHLVLTSDLGGEMLFQIHQNRNDVERVPNKSRVSRDECVQRLREFLLSKPDVEVCLVEQPFMDIITIDDTVPTTVEHNGLHQAICLYNDNDPQPTSSVFMGAYLDKNIDMPSKEYLGVETRFKVEKEDYTYCLHGNPNADVGANAIVSTSRLDVIRVNSTFEYDPTKKKNNWFDFTAGLGWKGRTVLRLKPSSAQRLKGQIMDTLVRLAELSPLRDDEDDADDWGCSEYVVGDYEVRQVAWIEFDAERDGTYEIRQQAYIKQSPTKSK